MTMDRYSTVALRIAAAAVIRAYLEYEAGGEPEPLRRFLSREAVAALDQHRPAQDATKPSAYAAIGPYAVLRLDQHRAYVCAGVLDTPGQDSVLVAELVVAEQGLQVARVGRAAEATTTLEVPPGPVGDGQPPPEAPPHIRSVLGDLPDTLHARELWLLGAAVVDTYRERHDLHGASLALGDAPQEPEQRAERDRAIAYLRELTRQIDRLEPDRAVEPRSPGREQELGR